MRVVFPVLAVGAALFLSSGLASAQSLGEVAAREKNKKKDAKPVKVITEDELRSSGRSGSGTANIMGGPVAVEASPKPGDPKDAKAPGKEGEKEKTPDEIREEAVKAWREKLQKAQADVARLNEDVSKMQLALNDISGPIYGSGRAAATERLEAAKKALADAQLAVTNTEEEGRRQGFR